MKFSDIVNKADKANPNATLDVTLTDDNGENPEEHTIVLRNLMRLSEEESKAVGKALEVLSLEGAELSEALTEEERDQTLHQVLANRMSAALRAVADDKDLWDLFEEPIRDKRDFKTWMLELFAGYSKETRLGEAETSGK